MAAEEPNPEDLEMLHAISKTVKDNKVDTKYDNVDNTETTNYKNLKEKEIHKWLEINGERIARELLKEEINKLKK